MDSSFPTFRIISSNLPIPLGEKHHLTLNTFAATDHFRVEETTSVEATEVTEVEGGQVEEETQMFEGCTHLRLFQKWV